MSYKGTLEILAREMALALSPLKEATTDLESFKFFMRQIGWDVTDLPPEYSSIVADVEDILNTVETLPEGATLEEIVELLEKVSSLYTTLKNLSNAPAGTNGAAFLNDFFSATFEYLIAKYLVLKVPSVYQFLEFSGIYAPKQYDSELNKPSFIRYKFDTDKISDFINNPVSLFKDVYNWGASDFLIQPLLRRITNWLYALGFNPRLVRDNSAGSRYNLGGLQSGSDLSRLEIPLFSVLIGNQIFEFGVAIGELPVTLVREFPGIIIEPLIPSELAISGSLNENWSFNIAAYTQLFEQFAILISPSGVSVELPAFQTEQAPETGVSVEFVYSPENPLILLGNPNESRVEFKGARIGLSIAGFSKENFEIVAEADLEKFKILIKGSEGDGFLNKILGNEELIFESDFGVKWSNISGFNFKGGGGGLTVGLAEHIEIGPLSIEQLKLAIRSITNDTSSGASALVTANIGLELGPFATVVKDLGISLKVKFEEGNAGPFDIGVGFKPPTGIGLKIDASAFKGGGFLSFDFEQERYIGALELTVKDKIALKVIGVLTTKLPGNEDGYSLLLLITAEFQPINLGFGFTLNGVGGLIALNRTMNLNFLRDGVKANTLDNILFPQDPIANINQIISDLEGAFPVEEGRYCFGPMAIIGWGTPTLITIELGLMLEVPNPVRLAILGVLKAILPSENKQLLKLQVNFLGTIDFEAKFITFDASIFESKLLSFTLEGDMAFRLKWGDNSNFLFSVGGFHPSYTPPPLQLPAMKRLTINFLGGDNPRLTLTAYLAVTSNTVQFGSAIDFYYRISNKYSVIGYLGFDILIQFNPFYLIAQIAASLALMKNGEAIVSIYLGGSVSGPAPWHVQGTAELKVCGITLKVNFDKTFGEPETTALPDIAVLPKLVEALSNKANWQADIPTNNNLLVSLREMDNAPGDIIAHPFGTLGVSQKIVPLNMSINKFGTQRPADFQKFELDIADSTGNNFEETALNDLFAPAEYLALSDSAKLSRKSFEEFNSGISVKGNNEIKSSYLMERDLEFEQIIMDSRNKPENGGIVREKPVSFRAFVKNGSSAKSILGTKSKPLSENAPARVTLAQEKFAIANVSNLTNYNDLIAGSEAEARVMLEELLEGDPALVDQIQVVPHYQLA